MNLYKMHLLFFTLIIAVLLSCKDDGEIDPEVAAMYKTGSKIKPLPEYTEENPREWAKIAPEHIPQAKMTSNKGRPAIVIQVPLKKGSTEHYIEKIGILDEKGRVIVSETIPRLPNPRTYAFFFVQDLPSDLKKLKIFIKCNLHDRWTVPLADAKWEE